MANLILSQTMKLMRTFLLCMFLAAFGALRGESSGQPESGSSAFLAQSSANGNAGLEVPDSDETTLVFEQTSDPHARRTIDFAPLFSIDTDVAGNRRWRALGPVVDVRESDEGRDFLAVRPFYTRSDDISPATADQHIVWPVWTRRRVGDESQWSLCQVVFWRDWDVKESDSQYAFRILPFYYQGRDSKGEDYLGVFPIAGSIHEFFLQDEISFILFPFYTHMRVNDVETWGYPWPIISGSSGSGVERFSVFPFYGRSKRRTDYDKYYVMWPFWNYAKFGFKDDTGYAYIAFPFYGHAKLDKQETFFILPPFIRFTKGDKMNLIYCPWPFFQKSSGEKDKLYIWPFWGRKSHFDRNTWFFLWPLVLGERHMDARDIESKRTVILPVFFLETRHRKSEIEPSQDILLSKQLKVWPLVSYWKDEDRSLFRAPSLWPFRDYKAIERNYAPFWTLYSRASWGAVTEDELLWGLFRYRRSDEGESHLSLFPLFSVSREENNKGREWSFLKGLVGYERTEGRKALRFLYFFKVGLGGNNVENAE